MIPWRLSHITRDADMDHDDIDDYVITIPFGKFRGQPITDIDSGYIGWLLDNAEHPWMNDAREALQQVIADRIETAHAAMPAYELNESQSQAVKLLADWLIIKCISVSLGLKP